MGVRWQSVSEMREERKRGEAGEICNERERVGGREGSNRT